MPPFTFVTSVYPALISTSQAIADLGPWSNAAAPGSTVGLHRLRPVPRCGRAPLSGACANQSRDSAALQAEIVSVRDPPTANTYLAAADEDLVTLANLFVRDVLQEVCGLDLLVVAVVRERQVHRARHHPGRELGLAPAVQVPHAWPAARRRTVILLRHVVRDYSVGLTAPGNMAAQPLAVRALSAASGVLQRRCDCGHAGARDRNLWLHFLRLPTAEPRLLPSAMGSHRRHCAALGSADGTRPPVQRCRPPAGRSLH